MTRDELTITLVMRIAASVKKKLKQDAQNLGIPMNRYAEQLFLGIRTAPKESTSLSTRNGELNVNRKGEVELPGGGTFTPARGYKHLRIKVAEEDLE